MTQFKHFVLICDPAQQSWFDGLTKSSVVQSMHSRQHQGIESVQLTVQATQKEMDAFESYLKYSDILYRTLDSTSFEANAIPAPTHWVTVMGSKIEATALIEINRIASQYDLKLHHSSTLTQTHDFHVIEMAWQGKVEHEHLHKALLASSRTMGCDIAVQEESPYRMRKALACFDMDSTLIKTEVIDELAEAAGVGEKVKAITERAMQGELDFNASFRERVALLAGLDEAVLESIAANLPIMDGADAMFNTLKRMGIKTAIFSGGFTYFARILQKRFGVDYVFANELDIKDGKVTGKVVSDIVDGNKKAELLQYLAKQNGLSLDQTVAVGDGANDLLMLAQAGLGVAFRAKPLVQDQAKHVINHMGLEAIPMLIGQAPITD